MLIYIFGESRPDIFVFEIYIYPGEPVMLGAGGCS